MKSFGIAALLAGSALAAPPALDARQPGSSLAPPPSLEARQFGSTRNDLEDGDAGSCPGSILIFARATGEAGNIVSLLLGSRKYNR